MSPRFASERPQTNEGPDFEVAPLMATAPRHQVPQGDQAVTLGSLSQLGLWMHHSEAAEICVTFCNNQGISVSHQQLEFAQTCTVQRSTNP